MSCKHFRLRLRLRQSLFNKIDTSAIVDSTGHVPMLIILANSCNEEQHVLRYITDDPVEWIIDSIAMGSKCYCTSIDWCYLFTVYYTGTHFTNDFSITIQIRWKFHLALIKLLMIISRQNLAHATTAQLSCHVPNIVAITFLVFGWEQNEISITFKLWWKNC